MLHPLAADGRASHHREYGDDARRPPVPETADVTEQPWRRLGDGAALAM